MKTHIEPASAMARARMVVDLVAEDVLDALSQPAGSTEVSNSVEMNGEVGMGGWDELVCVGRELEVESEQH